jgi:hypothetical protein
LFTSRQKRVIRHRSQKKGRYKSRVQGGEGEGRRKTYGKECGKTWTVSASFFSHNGIAYRNLD